MPLQCPVFQLPLALGAARTRPFGMLTDRQNLTPGRQVGTTKGTGGDVLILEEAAYVDPGFFYETVAPLTIVGNTTLLAISTLTSEINF